MNRMSLLHCAVALAGTTVFTCAATAQPAATVKIPVGYTRGFDGCPHRLPWAVLQGYPHINCTPNQSGEGPPPPRPVFSIATPSQVVTALECDFSAAATATRGKGTDISKAIISGVLTFTFVTKNSVGASLTIPAIPVFSAASVAPSLDASRLTNTMQSDEYSIKVVPAELPACPNPSANGWLTSKVMIDTIGGMHVTKVKTDLSFVLTNQGSAGLKLNIIPVAIGPQISSSNEKTQKVSLIFDFTGTPVQPPGASAQSR
jgi:hypothetical protein